MVLMLDAKLGMMALAATATKSAMRGIFNQILATVSAASRLSRLTLSWLTVLEMK
jgi:hypothetical protein